MTSSISWLYVIPIELKVLFIFLKMSFWQNPAIYAEKLKKFSQNFRYYGPGNYDPFRFSRFFLLSSKLCLHRINYAA